MNYHFHKMHGCGNDFLFLDAMESERPSLEKKRIVALCDRHFGIGADGLVILSRREGYDAQWDFYNCDGSRAEMCGNAARCAMLYLAEKYFPQKESISLMTDVGPLQGRRIDGNLTEVGLRVKGGPATEYQEKLIKHEGKALRVFFLNTGVPHAVLEVENLSRYPLMSVGRALLKHNAFGEQGTNVTFFERVSSTEIKCTTFERGVETETYACGTGVVAGALVYAQLYDQPYPIRVHVPGGTLIVDKADSPDAMLLQGPAEYVMEADWTGRWENSEKQKLFGSYKGDLHET